MKKNKTIELGRYKEIISKHLYKSDNIRKMIIGDKKLSPVEQIKEFHGRVKSHLFVDDTITDEGTFIFYDVVCPRYRAATKDIKIIMYIICHRNILDNFSVEGYYGNRADVLSEMVEDAIVVDPTVSNQFGIGELDLSGNDIYNSKRFYGRLLTFEVPNFR